MSTPENLFRIKKLSCAYGDKPPVLYIENMLIPSGKLIFVLGISGVGKSTFIETLGLMNRTIVSTPETEVLFYPDQENPIELKNFWQKSNEEVSAFRNQYLSFIFQDTNLMPNFTAGENMCISQLIRGMSMADAKKIVVEVMAELNLSAELFDRKITDLSGGQRQRLAFVRAITSDFRVLFGDEPTGNLDKDTAFRLMRMLKNNLHKHNRTGIIVSHDIDLALNFADEIILLTPGEEGTYGEALQKNLLYSKGGKWERGNGSDLEDASAWIYQKLVGQREKVL
ncbi:MAG: lipoprotein-releasing system ATP-binding protein [Saprospiraceae bacterium]|jgi:lipoprotein-releasing system ATP-binding protein